MMNERTKTKWILAAMFVAGLITGGAVTAGSARHFLPHSGMPTGAEVIKRIHQDLKSELKITQDQDRQIAPLLERHAVKLDAIRRDTAQQVLKIIDEKNAELAPILTAEQREKYERFENERLKHLRERAK